jgi:predicted TIM-barrel fold metal-dependent hydrolase
MFELTRRHVLSGAAAASAATAIAPPFAQLAAREKPHRIDVHHHFSPPQWIAAVKGRELLQRANTGWTPARSVEDMDNAGVATAVVSITNPGLWFGDKEATRQMARECNDYGAKLVQDNPNRFGLFAAMPLPDIDATLREIEYAYDTLRADGIHLFTSYGDTWLGNAAFTPVMAELNRRKAVIHVHPTAANCCKNLLPDVPSGIMEYGTDTTRAILGVMFSGTATRFPDIRYIWSHAGGTAPFLAGRIERGVRNLNLLHRVLHFEGIFLVYQIHLRQLVFRRRDDLGDHFYVDGEFGSVFVLQLDELRHRPRPSVETLDSQAACNKSFLSSPDCTIRMRSGQMS